MTFYAWELDICPSYGWQGGPSANTRIDVLRNRHERRNARSSLAQHVFTLPFAAIEKQEYLEELKAAHMVMYGMAHSFLVKDHLDYSVTLESLGTAPSGTTAVQLKKTYTAGPGSRVRNITHPVAGTVTVYQNGVAKAGTFSTTTGLFTPTTSWSAGQALTWTGEFRVCVRFNNDYMPMSIDTKGPNGHLVSGSVELIEVFGE